MSDDENQGPDRGREDGEESDGPGNVNDDGIDGVVRRRPRRRIVRAPPSPVWVRDHDGHVVRVDRTPLNVLLWQLGDPFLDNEEEEGEEAEAAANDQEEGGEEASGTGAGTGTGVDESVSSNEANYAVDVGQGEEEGSGGEDDHGSVASDDDDNDDNSTIAVDVGDEEEEEDGDDDDDHDSVESDDENNVVDVGEEPVEPSLALQLLDDLHLNDAYGRYRLRDLTVSFGADLVSNWHSHADVVRDLVQAIDAYRGIKRLHITRGDFGRDPDGPEDPDDDDDDDEIGLDLSQLLEDGDKDEDDCLEGLFGTVLCNHISLEEITFSDSRIPTKYWTLFTENFPASGRLTLEHLTLASTPLTMEHCQLLKRMLQRQVGISFLSIDECGLGPNEWRAVCEGVAGSGGQTVSVSLMEGLTVQPDTLLPLIHGPSTVLHLNVSASNWSEGAFEELVRGLRTNEHMRHLSLQSDQDFPHLHRVEELLTTYNCTLEVVRLDPSDEASRGRIEALVERNQLVGALGHPDGPTALQRYHVSRPAAWPRVLAEYGRLPTQLYRFLYTRSAAAADRVYRFFREGNLERFALRQVEAASAAAAMTAAAAAARAEAAAAAAAEAAAAVVAAAARPRGKKKRRHNLISK
jgi:hypothetical protein